MFVGYARVSTEDQDTDLQVRALRAAGVTRIYQEKGSGVGPRPQLQKALANIQRGETLVVWKLDRLARSLIDLLAILDRLHQSGASIKSVTEPIDTSSPIGSFVVQILGAVAELERNIIRERTKAGVMAAKERGAYLGRPTIVDDQLKAELIEKWTSGHYSSRQLAAMYGLSDSTLYRAIKGNKKPPRGGLK